MHHIFAAVKLADRKTPTVVSVNTTGTSWHNSLCDCIDLEYQCLDFLFTAFSFAIALNIQDSRYKLLLTH
ncbi:hypothetical protein [Nostoc sp. LPT]|uniref:hypothetical protein n=1 Tax=Nostoc sp. LPT TaxID=2815387 RepID=UPI001E1A15BB|nr:hypothetical protein [Nostoc sp. LPT]MBN4001956.1 hypothetical protein [Nostoc sp. LPT]